MSSSPRRSTPDATFDDNQNSIPDDQGMQDITISGEVGVNEDGGGKEAQPESSEPTVLDKSALRRYSAWITLVVASSIAYASLAVEVTPDSSAGGRTMSFVTVGSTLVISLGVAGCFMAPDCNSCTKAFVSPSSQTGRHLELFLSLLMFILWCIGLTVIMNPAKGIAISYSTIANANLYVASWICFGCVLFIAGDLVGDFSKGTHGTAIGLSRLDPETGEYVTAAPLTTVYYQRLWETRRGKWFALTALTLITLSTCVETFQAFSCGRVEMKGSKTCTDTKVALSMTVIGAILSLIMVVIGGIGSGISEYMEKIGALSTTVIWTICLIFITFGEGPGHSLNNMFFATWGGFFTSILITADCFKGWLAQRAQKVATEDANESNIEMNGLDDSDI